MLKRFENIAHTTNGLNQVWMQFLSQVINVYIQGIALDSVLKAIELVNKLLIFQDLVGVAHQGFQEAEFTAR